MMRKSRVYPRKKRKYDNIVYILLLFFCKSNFKNYLRILETK